MRELPLIRELIKEAKVRGMQKALLTVLKARFGPVPLKLKAELSCISSLRTLKDLAV
jgi:hypothetical protein